jgi:5-methylcytosine-specific restriction endonuclease McrA
MGWQIDHIKPQSKGGSHDIKNLHALNSSLNMSKGNTLKKKSRHNM